MSNFGIHVSNMKLPDGLMLPFDLRVAMTQAARVRRALRSTRRGTPRHSFLWRLILDRLDFSNFLALDRSINELVLNLEVASLIREANVMGDNRKEMTLNTTLAELVQSYITAQNMRLMQRVNVSPDPTFIFYLQSQATGKPESLILDYINYPGSPIPAIWRLQDEEIARIPAANTSQLGEIIGRLRMLDALDYLISSPGLLFQFLNHKADTLPSVTRNRKRAIGLAQFAVLLRVIRITPYVAYGLLLQRLQAEATKLTFAIPPLNEFRINEFVKEINDFDFLEIGKDLDGMADIIKDNDFTMNNPVEKRVELLIRNWTDALAITDSLETGLFSPTQVNGPAVNVIPNFDALNDAAFNPIVRLDSIGNTGLLNDQMIMINLESAYATALRNVVIGIRMQLEDWAEVQRLASVRGVLLVRQIPLFGKMLLFQNPDYNGKSRISGSVLTHCPASVFNSIHSAYFNEMLSAQKVLWGGEVAAHFPELYLFNEDLRDELMRAFGDDKFKNTLLPAQLIQSGESHETYKVEHLGSAGRIANAERRRAFAELLGSIYNMSWIEMDYLALSRDNLSNMATSLSGIGIFVEVTSELPNNLGVVGRFFNLDSDSLADEVQLNNDLRQHLSGVTGYNIIQPLAGALGLNADTVLAQFRDVVTNRFRFVEVVRGRVIFVFWSSLPLMLADQKMEFNYMTRRYRVSSADMNSVPITFASNPFALGANPHPRQLELIVRGPNFTQYSLEAPIPNAMQGNSGDAGIYPYVMSFTKMYSTQRIYFNSLRGLKLDKAYGEVSYQVPYVKVDFPGLNVTHSEWITFESATKSGFEDLVSTETEGDSIADMAKKVDEMANKQIKESSAIKSHVENSEEAAIRNAKEDVKVNETQGKKESTTAILDNEEQKYKKVTRQEGNKQIKKNQEKGKINLKEKDDANEPDQGNWEVVHEGEDTYIINKDTQDKIKVFVKRGESKEAAAQRLIKKHSV